MFKLSLEIAKEQRMTLPIYLEGNWCHGINKISVRLYIRKEFNKRTECKRRTRRPTSGRNPFYNRDHMAQIIKTHKMLCCVKEVLYLHMRIRPFV